MIEDANLKSPHATPLQLAIQQWDSDESALRGGGNAAGHQRQRRLGRLTARERLDKLLDFDSPRLELGLWAAWQLYPEIGDVAAAGVLCVIGRIHNRAVMVIANDATVKAGAFFPQTCKKVLRAQRIAFENKIPIVYLVDSAGVYLPMQDEVFPDEDDFGRIFRNNAVFSAAGLPQIAAVMGNCVAGGAYLPVLCDQVIMTQGSELYLAGPALVKAAIGQTVDAEQLGGATMHATKAGTIDYVAPDDPTCLEQIRRLMQNLPMRTVAPNELVKTNSLGFEAFCQEFSGNPRQEYDMRTVIQFLVDGDSCSEVKADYAKTIVTAWARIGGWPVGIVANQRKRTTTTEGELQLGGVLYPDAAEKAARFIMECNQIAVPLLFLQDVQGFMVGKEAEQSAIIRRGAKLVNAMANASVAKITLIVGGSYGAGHYALCGKAFDPAFIFAWPTARYAVMGPDQAATTLVQVQIAAAQKAGKPLSDEEIQSLRNSVRSNYTAEADIRYAAARGWVDAIINPLSTRLILIHSLQLIAGRRIPLNQVTNGVFQV